MLARRCYQLPLAFHLVLGVSVLGVSACRDEASPSPAPAVPPSASAPLTRNVVVEGDGHATGVALTPGLRLALTDALPGPLRNASAWQYVAVQAHDGRELVIRNWNGGYRGFRAVLYLDGDQATFGVFKEADGNSTKWLHEPRTKFGGVRRVDVRSVSPPVPSSAPLHSCMLVMGHTKLALTRAELAELPRVDDEQHEAWLLSDVLGLLGQLELERVELVQHGTRRTLSAADMKRQRPVLRFSGRGETVVTIGDEPKLRGVTEMIVTPSGGPAAQP